MAPLPPPGPPQQFCPRCRVPLPVPKPPYCPNCGMTLQERPVWLTVIAALGASFLGLMGICMGGAGACIALFVAAESKGGMFGADAAWVWGMLIGGVLCAGAALAILIWLVKKPK